MLMSLYKLTSDLDKIIEIHSWIMILLIFSVWTISSQFKKSKKKITLNGQAHTVFKVIVVIIYARKLKKKKTKCCNDFKLLKETYALCCYTTYTTTEWKMYKKVDCKRIFLWLGLCIYSLCIIFGYMPNNGKMNYFFLY